MSPVVVTALIAFTLAVTVLVLVPALIGVALPITILVNLISFVVLRSLVRHGLVRL